MGAAIAGGTTKSVALADFETETAGAIGLPCENKTHITGGKR
jgi:hypothetical protein